MVIRFFGVFKTLVIAVVLGARCWGYTILVGSGDLVLFILIIYIYTFLQETLVSLQHH